jgi:type VI secretion system protein VasD
MAPGSRALVLLPAIVSLAACWSSTRPALSDATSPLNLEITAGPRLNPDDQGLPLPTVVRIYQLRSAGKLERADFDRLLRQPREALGEDLLRDEVITLSAGETLKRTLERERGARYLAVIALFRRPTGSSWKAIAELGVPARSGGLKFVVDGYRVERR